MQYAVLVYRNRRSSLRGPYDTREMAQAVLNEEMAHLSGVREPCGVAITCVQRNARRRAERAGSEV